MHINPASNRLSEIVGITPVSLTENKINDLAIRGYESYRNANCLIDSQMLIRGMLTRIFSIALRIYHNTNDTRIQIADLISAGFVGCLEAIKAYDEDKRDKNFSYHANYYIRNAIYEEFIKEQSGGISAPVRSITSALAGKYGGNTYTGELLLSALHPVEIDGLSDSKDGLSAYITALRELSKNGNDDSYELLCNIFKNILSYEEYMVLVILLRGDNLSHAEIAEELNKEQGMSITKDFVGNKKRSMFNKIGKVFNFLGFGYNGRRITGNDLVMLIKEKQHLFEKISVVHGQGGFKVRCAA